MSDLINPHDKLFKEIEKIRENCRDLIESSFPEELLEKLDLDTLTNDNNSYIDETLQEYYSDIVYNCQYDSSISIKISILFEHKSYKPKNEYLQLLRYIVSIWNFAEKNNEDLPLVIPVIFYHGNDVWEIKPIYQFFRGIDDILGRFVPAFTYILTDLNTMSDSVILEEKFNRDVNKVMALLFKHMKDEEYLRERLKDIFTLLKGYFGEKESSVVITFLFYLMSITEIENNYIKKCLNAISPEGGKIAMTTAMKLRNEGIKEGIQEGIQEGKYEAAKKMLKKGFSVDDIVEITDLSREEIEKLKEDLH